METTEYHIPSDEEIVEAQKVLGITFHPDYIDFIKSGYDMGDSILEPLLINLPGSHVDLFKVMKDAREYYDLPIELLPICEDNADYFCLTKDGEVVFWSHNGTTDEKWSSISEWRKQMIAEGEPGLKQMIAEGEPGLLRRLLNSVSYLARLRRR